MQEVIQLVGDPAVLDFIEETLASNRQKFDAIRASSLEELVEQVKLHPSAIVLTDIPGETSVRDLEKVAACSPTQSSPIIVITAPENEKLAVKALRDVAASYVPTRFIESELVLTINNVANVAKAHTNRMRVMECVKLWHNEFELKNDPSMIGPLVSYLQESTQRMGLLSEPGEETRLGVALEEALLNAMHHGNLEVSSALREEDDSKFYAMVKARQTEEPYSNRRVRVRAEFCPEKVLFIIHDEGPGFDMSQIPDPTDPENVERVCGRGMLLMRTFMDEVTYNDVGNEVTLLKRRQAEATQSEAAV